MAKNEPITKKIKNYTNSKSSITVELLQLVQKCSNCCAFNFIDLNNVWRTPGISRLNSKNFFDMMRLLRSFKFH